jgi:hypothetical protein
LEFCEGYNCCVLCKKFLRIAWRGKSRDVLDQKLNTDLEFRDQYDAALAM